MCRNHRGFIEASIAINKLGADVLYLNTAFAGPQLADVSSARSPSVVIHDEEFTGCSRRLEIEERVIGWTDATTATARRHPRGADRGRARRRACHRPRGTRRTIILTSGTTGTPKGAPRRGRHPRRGRAAVPDAAEAGWTCHIAAPLFHTWGFAHTSGDAARHHDGADPEVRARDRLRRSPRTSATPSS